MNEVVRRLRPSWDDLRAAYHHELLFTNVGPAQLRGSIGGDLVYLATPYTKQVVDAKGHFDSARSLLQMNEAAKYCAMLARLWVTAASPIVLADSMLRAENRLDPLDPVFWTRWCRPLLDACRAVVIPDLDGWRDSEGVHLEAAAALAFGRPVYVLDADFLDQAEVYVAQLGVEA